MQGVSQGMRVEGCSQICTGLLMTLKFLGALPYVSGTLKDKRGNPTKATERNVFFNCLKSDTFLPRSFITRPRNPMLFFVLYRQNLPSPESSHTMASSVFLL